MEEKTVKRYSLSRQVADQLEKMIEDGKYGVGEKIPTEPELSEMFGVSRNTLRESIQSLTAAGILAVKQGDGTYVRSNNRFYANMNMKYEQVSMHDILEARNALELTIAQLAALRRTEEELDKIREALEVRRQLSSSEKENTRADMNFHTEIAFSCHNRILIDLYNSIYSYMEDHIASRQKNTMLNDEQIDELHEKLFEAIRDQNAEEARIYAQNIIAI